MILTIKWNTLSIDEWERKFSLLPRSNILQTYDYARIVCPAEKQKGRWGLIEIDGREAGLVQILEAGIFWNGLHALIVDRGPLWFEGFGNAMHIKKFFEELNRQFPQRLGRKRRIIPETDDGPTAQKMIEQAGLSYFQKGYETIWVDLTLDEEVLRAGMKSNWRNKLSKAEKSDLDIRCDVTGQTLPWLLSVYEADKEERGYGGPSPAFIKEFAAILVPQGKAIVLVAEKAGEPIAFTLFVTHGRSATYLVGWSSMAGRETAAHHLLLWEGVKMLKGKGIKELDLGGVNDESAEGIKTFKEGLGGRSVRTVGHYI